MNAHDWFLLVSAVVCGVSFIDALFAYLRALASTNFVDEFNHLSRMLRSGGMFCTALIILVIGVLLGRVTP